MQSLVSFVLLCSSFLPLTLSRPSYPIQIRPSVPYYNPGADRAALWLDNSYLPAGRCQSAPRVDQIFLLASSCPRGGCGASIVLNGPVCGGRTQGTMNVEAWYFSLTGSITPTSNVTAWSDTADPFTFTIVNDIWTELNNTDLILPLLPNAALNNPAEPWQTSPAAWRYSVLIVPLTSSDSTATANLTIEASSRQLVPMFVTFIPSGLPITLPTFDMFDFAGNNSILVENALPGTYLLGLNCPSVCAGRLTASWMCPVDPPPTVLSQTLPLQIDARQQALPIYASYSAPPCHYGCNVRFLYNGPPTGVVYIDRRACIPSAEQYEFVLNATNPALLLDDSLQGEQVMAVWYFAVDSFSAISPTETNSTLFIHQLYTAFSVRQVDPSPLPLLLDTPNHDSLWADYSSFFSLTIDWATLWNRGLDPLSSSLTPHHHCHLGRPV